MPRQRKVTVYTVQTVWWHYNDEFYDRFDGDYTGSGDDAGGDLYDQLALPVPVQTFLSRDKAEAHRAALDRKRRADVNPFRYGGFGDALADFTSLKSREFNEGLCRVGLREIRFERNGRTVDDSLSEWWELSSEDWTETQRRAIRQAMDRVVFYQVSELAE